MDIHTYIHTWQRQTVRQTEDARDTDRQTKRLLLKMKGHISSIVGNEHGRILIGWDGKKLSKKNIFKNNKKWPPNRVTRLGDFSPIGLLLKANSKMCLFEKIS